MSESTDGTRELNFDLPLYLIEAIDKLAQEANQTRDQYVEQILIEFLEKIDAQDNESSRTKD